jgi:hypothetical protein
MCDALRAGVHLPMHPTVGCKGEVGLSDEPSSSLDSINSTRMLIAALE